MKKPKQGWKEGRRVKSGGLKRERERDEGMEEGWKNEKRNVENKRERQKRI